MQTFAPFFKISVDFRRNLQIFTQFSIFSAQFLHSERSSFGLNLGIRSVYQGSQYIGGSTNFGEGLSAGFRWDYELSDTSGIAFGAEQLFHFDSTTDTGRNIYLTISKGWTNKSVMMAALLALKIFLIK